MFARMNEQRPNQWDELQTRALVDKAHLLYILIKLFSLINIYNIN